MFKAFTFKTLASLALIAAVAAVGAADPALAKKKKPDVPSQQVPGHWERSEDGGFEWVGKKLKKMPMTGQPVVRDHRNNGGVTVSDTGDGPIVRDHRTQPVVRDHRSNGGGVTVSETADGPTVRDHRKKKIYGMPVWN
ncbi:hypothetical protein [Taklimakanibacter deserti]|uniref:hypothetical protein n=1 Tax=Taklimakanibacter deserti TaxID=2267839 RepID=UPI000E656DCC